MSPSFCRRLVLSFCSTFAVLLLCLPRTANAADAEAKRLGVTIHKDMVYYQGADMDPVKHKLDLYLPKDKTDFPVLFFIHGGAWVHGDKTIPFLGVYSSLGRYYASQGIGAVVINYRLSPHVKHPEHIKDVARAFAWTEKNIKTYGGRPDQIFVCGHSAGGHLAALLATDEAYLKAEGLTLKNIKGVIPISGVYNVDELPGKLMNDVFGKDESIRKQASPMFNAKPGLPPFLILGADKDLLYCDKGSAFCKALDDQGCSATFCEIKDSNHILILLSAYNPDSPVSKKILDFIQTQSRK